MGEYKSSDMQTDLFGTQDGSGETYHCHSHEIVFHCPLGKYNVTSCATIRLTVSSFGEWKPVYDLRPISVHKGTTKVTLPYAVSIVLNLGKLISRFIEQVEAWETPQGRTR